MKRRSIVYIDGFNLYYGALKGGPDKWLNLYRYFCTLRQNDVVERVYYFTAEVAGPNLENQRAYFKALATTPHVKIILGRFKPKDVKCRVRCCEHVGRRKFTVSAEKRTDVHIALQMLEDAYEDRADTFIVVSGDSDLVPAVHRVRNRFPEKRVIVYVPARDPDRSAAVELRSAATSNRDLPLALLPRSQFPPTVPDGSGGTVEKPAGW